MRHSRSLEYGGGGDGSGLLAVFFQNARVDERLHAQAEKNQANHAHGDLHDHSHRTLGGAGHERAEFGKSHTKTSEGSQQTDQRGEMHHMHAGFVEHHADNSREKNCRSEERGNERSDALGSAKEVSPDAHGFEDESENNRECRHGRKVCVCGL